MREPLRQLRGTRAHEVLLGEVIAASFGFLLTIIAAARLGAEEFGVFSVAWAAVTTATVLLDIRVEDVAARRFQALGESPDRAAAVWSSYFWVDVAYAAIRLAVVASALPVIVWVYGEDALKPAILLAISLAISNADQTVIALLNVRFRRRTIAFARAGLPLLRLLGFAVLLPTEAVLLAAVYLGSALVYSVALAFTARPVLRGPSTLSLLREERRHSARLLTHLSLASSLRGVGSNLPQLLVGALLGNAAAGIFRLSASIATIPVLVASVGRFLAFPVIIDQTLRGAVAALRRSLRTLSLFSAAICLVALVGWAVTGRVVIDAALDDSYAPVFTITLILLFGAACEYATPWSKILPTAFNRGGLATSEAIWYALVPLILAPPLIHFFGLEGAAWSSVITSGFASLGWWWYSERLLSDAFRSGSETAGQPSAVG